MAQQAAAVPPAGFAPEWQLITGAPYEVDLELAVLDVEGAHALVFPCRRSSGGWVKSNTAVHVDVHPTHWRHWRD